MSEAASTGLEVGGKTIEFIFGRKGSPEIICLLGDQGPQRLKSIVDKIQASRSTLNKRVQVGKNIGIWKPTLQSRNANNVVVYELTDEGQLIYDELANKELNTLYESRRTIQDQIGEAESQVKENLDTPTVEEAQR